MQTSQEGQKPMKIDETQQFYALYNLQTSHILAVFDDEHSAQQHIDLCLHRETLSIISISMAQLIRSYELWHNIERRYA